MQRLAKSSVPLIAQSAIKQGPCADAFFLSLGSRLRSKHYCVNSTSFRRLHRTAWPSQQSHDIRPSNRVQRRHFIQLPSLPKLPNLIKPMSTKRHYKDRTLLKYSQQEFYDLVANVDDYQLFLPWCTYSKMSAPLPLENPNSSGRKSSSTPLLEQPWLLEKKLHPAPVVMVRHGELGIGFSSFQERYVSKVTCQAPWTVQAVSYDSKLFRELSTTWQFTPNVPKTTTLEATLDGEVNDESQLMKKDMTGGIEEEQDKDLDDISTDAGLVQDRDRDQAQDLDRRQAVPIHHFTAAAVFGSQAIPPQLNKRSEAVSASSSPATSTISRKRVSSPSSLPKEEQNTAVSAPNPESSTASSATSGSTPVDTAVTEEIISPLLDESQPSPSFPRPPRQTIERTASPSNLATMSPSDYPSCWVDFEIQFEFASPVHASMSSLFFDQVSKEMLQAFIKRAEVLYGKR